MTSVPDAVLVASALTGDKAAFAELLARHRPTVEQLAARLLGDAELARDAGQEAAVVALVSLERLRSPDRFGAWLCGIGLNVARRWLGERRPRLAGTRADGPDGGPGPEEAAELAALARRVRAAVATLAPGQRDAVLLFYLQGLSHREVAAELGISVGAVKARLHQARAALAPRLAPDLAEEPTVPETMPATGPDDRWVDVTVADVRAGGDPGSPFHVVVLEDGRGRQLPIWIAAPEALALAICLTSEETPRPMTYQSAAALLEAAGARLAEARVTRLAGGVFYGVVVVEGPAGRREVDTRPSDALNLALVARAPIRVDAGLLDDPAATGRTGWRDYPASAADLVADMRRGYETTMAALAAERGEGSAPAP